jgi:uncharacterized protein YbjT (DUF2867 family)
MILVTGATGMFGGRVARGLAEQGAPVRALVRDRGKAADLEAAGAELAVADMDRPETLAPALEGVQRVFLVSPMDDRIEARETAVVAASKEAGVDLVVKVYGAVKHDDDPLERQHRASIEALRSSGLRWALLSPNSVMETSLIGWAQPIKQTGQIFASAGDARVALVAADDCGAAGVALLTGEPDPERSYKLTGPQALTCADMAAALSQGLGRPIAYVDMSEDDLRDLLVKYAGMTPEQAEIGVLAHYRAWKQGGAAEVTGTVKELTGRDPVSVDQWLPAHVDAFR